MLSILKRFSLFFLALPLAIPAFVTVAQAQDGADEVIEEIVTTGTRRAARSAYLWLPILRAGPDEKPLCRDRRSLWSQ